MVNRVETIWKKVDVRTKDECWPFKGHRSWGKRGGGYGRLDVENAKGVYAHRVAYLAANPGSITLDRQDGLLVLHSCDNPICCNPRHLRVGTHKKNMRDKVRRGRSKIWESSIKSPRAKFTAEKVRRIRQQHAEGIPILDIAKENGVSRSCIYFCVKRWHYADVI